MNNKTVEKWLNKRMIGGLIVLSLFANILLVIDVSRLQEDNYRINKNLILILESNNIKFNKDDIKIKR